MKIMANKSKIKITLFCILILSVIFVTIKDTQTRETEYKYYIYDTNGCIGKCKDIETTKYMSLIKVINFVDTDKRYIKTCYMSENYIFTKIEK